MIKRIDPSYAMLVVALVIGAATRLIGLTSSSIYVDEIHTFQVATQPLRDMISILAATDYHPPLFYAITHFLVGLHMPSDRWPHEWYRYFTAPFALVTIVATWAIARRLFGPVAAGVAALIIAIDPTSILWDRIYRMYVVFDALVAVSWWLLIEAERAEGRRRIVLWALFALCAITQPYLHYLGILNVACQFLYGLAKRRSAWPAAAGAVLAGLSFLPWLPYMLRQLPGGGLVAGTASLPIEWWTIARDAVLDGTPLAWIRAPGFDVVVTFIVVAMCVWAAWSARRTVLPFWLLVAALQVVLSLISGKFLAAPRYLLPVLPVFAIGVGQVVDRHLLLPNVRIAAFAVGGAIFALLAFCTTNVLFDPLYQFPDWNLVQSIFEQREQRSDIIVFDQGYMDEISGAYGSTYVDHPELPIVGPTSVSALARWLSDNPKTRVWYIENQYYYVDPNRRAISYLESMRPQLGEWLEPRVELSNRVYVVLFGPAHRFSRN
ncbi:MAG TPA: glycosyltransferase family 39 protein [Candidatus Eremiobacteraceae bacterium]|nr:glycosyltransferase family 39 protein [Candidatus Eremiobacteraceae bacterium]